MRKIKKTKLEKTIEKKERIAYLQKGTGIFLFRNKNKDASLELPKISKDGKKWVEPNGTWEGDSYFLSMVPKEAVIVKNLEENMPREEIKMEEKLILDQPEQITKEGKVEHKIKKELPLNEVSPQEENEDKEKLLTEDPLAGVTIIRD